jgi:predicted nuclease of predicted toxin-antitoxin system
MSRSRFLANHDLTEAILAGVMRREPAIEFRRLRDLGMADQPDAPVLDYAARNGLVIVSHDVSTMTAHAADRVAAGLPMPGVLLVHQGDPIGTIIEDLILIWAASEAEEWAGQVVFLPIR